MEPRTLKYIAEATEGELLNGSPGHAVTRLCTDSRQAQPGDLFFALAGERFDGHTFPGRSGAARRGRGRGGARANCRRISTAAPSLPWTTPARALGRLGARLPPRFRPARHRRGRLQRQDHDQGIDRLRPAPEKGDPLERGQFQQRDWRAADPAQAGTFPSGRRAGSRHQSSRRTGAAAAHDVARVSASITNIGREHLEFFHDLVGVAREEGAIAEALPPDGVLFLNGDNPWSEILARALPRPRGAGGLGRGQRLRGAERAGGRKRRDLFRAIAATRI